MAYISYTEVWESESDHIFPEKDKMQDVNVNQFKLEIHDTYKRNEKITTNFEPIEDSDAINKTFIDKKLSKTEGQIS